MAGSSRELRFPRNSGATSLREQLARTTLRNVKSKVHQYVELREDNKKPIFFCILCLSPCHSDTVLHDHLGGHLHKKMYEAAKSTLLKENPWPFNDGMLFFHTPSNENDCMLTPNANFGSNLLENVGVEENSLAIVNEQRNHDESVDINLIIPDVLIKDKVSDLQGRLVGVGQIGVRYFQKDGVTKGYSRIWCEWLGDDQDDMVPQHDFGIVSFAFDYDMGRKGVLDDMFLLPSYTREENNTVNKRKKKRKSFSDPEDVSEVLSNQYESCGEECLTSKNNLVSGYGDNTLQLRVMPSRSVRKELRVHRRLASERVCDICQQKMLPGKDVATLVNMKTGRIVCSSRNLNGAFHVFHISCLVHWVLLCEYEVATKQLVGTKLRRKKGAAKGVEEVMKKQIYSSFCPECQGTGIDIDGDELEKPTVSLSEMFKYKMKACDGHREYMKRPEMLENCSTGFCFPPPQSEETLQENVSTLKIICIYRAAAD